MPGSICNIRRQIYTGQFSNRNMISRYIMTSYMLPVMLSFYQYINHTLCQKQIQRMYKKKATETPSTMSKFFLVSNSPFMEKNSKIMEKYDFNITEESSTLKGNMAQRSSQQEPSFPCKIMFKQYKNVQQYIYISLLVLFLQCS